MNGHLHTGTRGVMGYVHLPEYLLQIRGAIFALATLGDTGEPMVAPVICL